MRFQDARWLVQSEPTATLDREGLLFANSGYTALVTFQQSAYGPTVTYTIEGFVPH